ncbi:MAG: MBL fold metallo-hydrolase [Gammaproteobacteria bacterium]|nr:MBL fold metallo-hydrolase [Gammaproteobacteria bacterium]
MDIMFLGATGTVTGSKYLVTAGAKKILVDCGLFQGYKQLRLRNWAPFPFPAAEIDAVVLTHAHLDHSGYLPLLIKSGFTGKVYCSDATRDLCAILLPDSGHLQEEEAEYANRRGISKHKPALPLYTQVDGEQALSRFTPIAFNQDVTIAGDVKIRLAPAGHLLGAAIVRLDHGGTSLVFSGDLGRPNDPILVAPTAITRADYLVIESTYGDRLHDPADPKVLLASVVNRTVARGGVVIVPAFAVGRAQTLMYLIHQLKEARTIPDIPVYLNSPMAVNATRIFHHHRDEHRLTPAQCDAMCGATNIVNSVDESKHLNTLSGPMIIISASGMATGGRVVHHLKAFAPDARNTILFAGFQAGGTRGAAMLAGAETIKIHGEYVPVRAEIARLDNLSGHADDGEILEWLRRFEAPPRKTFITHGEPQAVDALRRRIEEALHWSVAVPEYREQAALTAVAERNS